MDDSRNNREYDAFFQMNNRQRDHRIDNKDESGQQADDSQSSYYAYGPYRPDRGGQASNSNSPYESVNPVQHSTSTEQAPATDVTVYAQASSQGRVDSDQMKQTEPVLERNWQYRPPRRRWFSSFVAAFLVCALIMTGLAYAADTGNWFTGSVTSSSGSGGASKAAPIGQTVVETDSSSRSQEASGIIRPNTIADIVEEASPAVVLIETYVSAGRNFSGRNNRDFFEYFFGDRLPQPNQNDGGKVKAGLGSGFIFDRDGYILTNEHVVSGAEEIYVTVQGHKEPFKAELLGSDFDLDLAVLKISGNHDFSVLPIGDSGSLRVGDWVTAIGNPGGFEHTVSVGVLSGTGRNIQIPEGNQIRNYEHLLQTDAAINPGNSGGPLINMNGEVVGINTAVSVDAQGIGFAIPSSTIVSVLDLLKNNQSVPKPYIGVVVTNIDKNWQEDLKLSSTDGALITQVESGSPAARAGLRAWDVIVKINDKDVKNIDDVLQYIQELGVNTRTTITFIRDGKEVEAGIIIGDRNG